MWLCVHDMLIDMQILTFTKLLAFATLQDFKPYIFVPA